MPATTRSKNRRKKLKQRRKNRFRNRVKNRYRYEETPEVSAVGDYDYEDSNQVQIFTCSANNINHITENTIPVTII
jgi:hypothetical protein